MDFNDFRLFVMPDASPDRTPQNSGQIMTRRLSDFDEVYLTDASSGSASNSQHHDHVSHEPGNDIVPLNNPRPEVVGPGCHAAVRLGGHVADNARAVTVVSNVRTVGSTASCSASQSCDSLADTVSQHCLRGPSDSEDALTKQYSLPTPDTDWSDNGTASFVRLSQDADWAHMTQNDTGDDYLSPVSLTDIDDQRLSKSLDLGHDELGNDVSSSNSFPWQAKARTLDSPKRSSTSGTKADKKSPTDGDKIKFKLMSVWNNMKFEMKPKTSFKVDSPIWMLGTCYHCTREQLQDFNSHSDGKKGSSRAFESFKKDFISKVWFTYRQNFPKLLNSQLTTDVGWGCMLRTGQMMLAQALVLHFLGRDWRWHSHQKKYEMIFHHQIIKFFGDSPDKECPFSMHRLVQIGAETGKKPGDWYGPASVAFVLREAVERVPSRDALLSQICLYVAQDCTIYKQDVLDLCTRPAGSKRCTSSTPDGTAEEMWRAIIILIPVRLGGEVLNPIYASCLRQLLTYDLCLGIIGGRPRHSLYFIGWQEDKLINLDPHLCQDFVDVRDRNFPLQTFHCMSPRKMAISRMDPSCTIGFYCKTRHDFTRFVHDSKKLSSPPGEHSQYPMYVFHDGRCSDLMQEETHPTEERYLRVRRLDKKGRPKAGKPKEADDFVFL